MNKNIDDETITVGQIKAIALLMTDLVRAHNSDKEWVSGVDDLVKRIIDYIKVCR